LSLHYYTANWGNKGSATDFGEEQYFDILRRCLHIEDVIDDHMRIMDQYDPEKNVTLIFDEWGTWYDVEPGTNPGFLFQQNTMRDALVAGLTLNYLNERCERVKMANIAQTINVLQSLIFTEGEKMLLTPTYHIYDMYKVHHDATLLPIDMVSSQYSLGDQALPAVQASASLSKEGKIHISLVNIDPEEIQKVIINLKGTVDKSVSGTILSGSAINSHNTFENPKNLVPEKFSGAIIRGDQIALDLPAHSVLVLEIL
jgi:alpha-N-arabinofuranosidase